MQPDMRRLSSGAVSLACIVSPVSLVSLVSRLSCPCLSSFSSLSSVSSLLSFLSFVQPSLVGYLFGIEHCCRFLPCSSFLPPPSSSLVPASCSPKSQLCSTAVFHRIRRAYSIPFSHAVGLEASCGGKARGPEEAGCMCSQRGGCSEDPEENSAPG